MKNAISDEELAEFLDWQFVTGSKDFKMFKHLKQTGYLDENPITSKMLADKTNKKIKTK